MVKLPPFRLAPYFRTRVWGFNDLAPWYNFHTDGEPIGEVWLTGEMCLAENGPCSGESLAEIARTRSETLLGDATGVFPLLVKVLFPREKLSVQVHPDDRLAQKYGEPRGKTECWYALDAEAGAKVALGIRPGATAEQVRAGIENSTLENLLEWVPVQKGDMLFVDAGTVHAIAPGAVLLETQQTSDLTYRMYDYGRPRELHVEKSMEAMRLTTRAGKVPPEAVDDHAILLDETYFRVERWNLDGAAAPELSTPCGRVQMLFVAEGDIEIQGSGFSGFSLSRGQLAVVPADSMVFTVLARSRAEVIRMLPAKTPG